MDGKVMYDVYKSFVIQIIERQRDDFYRKRGEYRKLTLDQAIIRFSAFCRNNKWFEYIDLDREWYLQKSIEGRLEREETNKNTNIKKYQNFRKH